MKKILHVLLGAVWGIWGIFGGVINGSLVYAEGVDDVVGAAVTSVAMMPNVFIKAVNPGYTVDGISNVGEMIEISRGGDSDDLILLAGLVLDYTNSSGNRSVLVEFPEHTYLAGESILLSLASSPESELAALTYSKTLAFKASGLRLMYGETVVDAVCWDSSEGCEKEFKSKEPTMLVRGDGGWTHVPVGEYGVRRDVGELAVIEPEEPVEFEEPGRGEVGPGDEPEMAEILEPVEEPEPVSPQCRDLVFSEIMSYYNESQDEQFIELYNAGLEEAVLNGCNLKYKNKLYPLEGVVEADGYFARWLTDFAVAKDPSKVGVVELVDVDNVTVDVLEYPHGQKKKTSFALVGYDDEGGVWEITYAITPGAVNEYQEFRSCEEGKVINPTTGNCVKVVETAKAEKICPVGYYLNIATNRCRKIQATVEKVCEDGYYLNEETGRCKKIVENNGASFALEPEEYEEGSSFVGLVAVLVVVLVALVYVVFEFRHEILKKLRFLKR